MKLEAWITDSQPEVFCKKFVLKNLDIWKTTGFNISFPMKLQTVKRRIY